MSIIIHGAVNNVENVNSIRGWNIKFFKALNPPHPNIGQP